MLPVTTSVSPPVAGPKKFRGGFAVVNSVPGRNPTSATSETLVDVKNMGWHGDSPNNSKFSYIEDGKAKDAPSALHSVIIPNVNLPKVRVGRSGVEGSVLTDGLGAPRALQQVRKGWILGGERFWIVCSVQRYPRMSGVEGAVVGFGFGFEFIVTLGPGLDPGCAFLV